MIDEASFVAKAGKGGDGQVSFRREKNRPNGGPDGGNGSRGSSIYVESNHSINTLRGFAGRKRIVAENGARGKRGIREGEKTEDITLQVPIGTAIYNADTGKLIIDMDKPGMRFCLARGGKGGKGNWCFKSPTNVSPIESTKGGKTKPINVQLKLKVLAQIGLAGLPNAGKSTMLSILTKAKPKIANYHFTTLSPNLGVLETVDKLGSLVIADIPGLIEGASEGKGLGIQFLKHLQRCQLIVYVLYPEEYALGLQGEELGKYLWEQKLKIQNEMEQFNPGLLELSSMVIVNKNDLMSQEQRDAMESYFKEKNQEVLLISAATGENMQELALEMEKRYRASESTIIP